MFNSIHGMRNEIDKDIDDPSTVIGTFTISRTCMERTDILCADRVLQFEKTRAHKEQACPL